MDYEQILFTVEERVATITLNRPARMNAWTSRMGVEVRHALGEVDRRDDVRVAIVTGAGKAFCAGADLEGEGKIFAGAAAPDGPPPPPAWAVRKPIIAAINGVAVGVGATIPLQWDLRLAGESARIGFIFVRRGLVPEAASTWILPRLVGMARAAELLYTGRILPAAECLAFGLVSRVVPDAELLPTARELARDVAVNAAPVAVALTKRLLWRMQDVPGPSEANALDLPVFRWTTQTPDAKEGVKAFLEKRPPSWTMNPSTDLPDLDELLK